MTKMAFFRKFFFRKPPDGLLEISDRVYVFDCCFTLDVIDAEEYGIYVRNVMGELREYFYDASFVVFNLCNRENQSQIAEILSDYGVAVLDYPGPYENCPILTMEMIHHFLKSSESWLSIGERNVLLLHCEHGAWPVLAFMLASLLIYKNQFTGEEKTLSMIYKQTPPEILQLLIPLNPVPSQLRYLQYVSRRNLGSEWPPLIRALTLDCIILRDIPNMDGEGGCRPIFRIYGPDPFMTADRTPKVLFSTPKRSKMVQRYEQADSELVKIDINCHIQGDVVLECITLANDLEHEEMMFRIMFNTAFIRSNILILNADEIDTLWNAKDKFSGDFSVEVLFSEMNSSSSVVSLDLPVIEDKGGLPIEAFANAHEKFKNVVWRDLKADPVPNMLKEIASNITEERREKFRAACGQNLENRFSKHTMLQNLERYCIESTKEEACETISLQIAGNEGLETVPSEALAKVQEFGNTDWLDPNVDVALNILQITASNILQEKLESSLAAAKDKKNAGFPWNARTGIVESVSSGSSREVTSKAEETPNSYRLKHDAVSSQLPALEVKSIDQPESFLDFSLLGKKRVRHELVSPSQRPFQAEISSPKTPESSMSCPDSLLKYQNSPSSIGITSLLNDKEGSKGKLGAHVVTLSPRSALSASFPYLCKPVPPDFFSMVLPSELSSSAPTSSSKINKVSAANSPSLSPVSPSASSTLAIPNHSSDVKLNTRSQLLSGSVRSPKEWDSVSKFNSETPLQVVAAPFSFINDSLGSSPTSPPNAPLCCFSVASELQERRTKPLSPLSLHCEPVSTAPPLSPPAFSSSDTVLPSPKHSPSTSNLSPKRVSSPGLVSLITPVNNSEFSASPPFPRPPPPPPPPPPGQVPSPQNLVPISSTASKMSKLPPPPPPPPPPPCHQNLGSISSPAAKLSQPPIPPPPAPPPPPTSSSAGISASPVMDFLPPTGPPPPPPPPSHSISSLNNSTSSHAPPPPPPPLIPANQSISKVPQHGPPIPPPLAPFSNSASQNHSISGPGNIPPTPAPPLGLQGRQLQRLTPKNQSQTKRASLKPYHWLKLTRVVQGSLWADAQKPEEASTTPEFDMSELESLFSTNVPNSVHGNSAGNPSRASRKNSAKVTLIDLRRAYNCEIMLSKVKIPLPELMSSALTLDESTFDIDQVDNLIKFCPTKEEMEILQNYKGDKTALGKCEQFFMELMKVPRVESKLRVLSFKMQFSSQVSDLTKSLNLVNSASEEIRNSVKLKRTMQTILSLGNALNHGTARGSAVGFRLDSLLKLIDTRARNNKMTLMHYLCKVIAKKLPEILDFPKDLTNLEAAAKIQLKYLAEEMQAISKGLEKVVQELAASENDGHISENFCKVLKEFVHFAEVEVKSLASLYSGVGRNADALALYFGEDPARCPFEQVVSTLVSFVRMFVRSHEENCKQLEFEKKRAIKEAEKAKLKGNTLSKKTNDTDIKKDNVDVPNT